MAGLKTATGEAIDGSFELQVDVDMDEDDAMGQPCPIEPPGPTAVTPSPTATSRTLSLRVTGDLHIGGLMLLIVETIGVPRDWSDHALWWPQRRHWLLRSSRSLDALGVGGASRLRFTRQHRPLRLRMPHGRRLRMRLSFARALPHAVAEACGVLGIRHPEELSLLRPPEEEEGGGGDPPVTPDFDLTHICPPQGEEGPWQEPPPHLPLECYRMLVAPRGGLAPVPPPRPPRGNPLLRRTRLHSRWLDSSRSLLEQDVADDEELVLSFKYHCFMELEPRGALRVALLYEQARWALLREEIDCTEEEMLLFAALQYQIDEVGAGAEPGGAGGGQDLDDLDAALNNLEVKLGGEPEPPVPLEELAAVPELSEELEVYRPRRLTLRGFRPVHAVLKDTVLVLGRSPPGGGEPPLSLNLRGCEVTPDVDVVGRRFCLKLLVPTPEGMSELHLRCRDALQYSRWVTGCRLSARGRSLSDPSFAAEARAVQALLGLPPSGHAHSEAPPAPTRTPPDPRVLLPPRMQRKGKVKQLVPRILEVLHRVGALSPAQARLRFLQAWKALPGFGLAYFLVRFQGSRRDEILGVGPSRILRMEPSTGAVIRAWRYSSLRRWNVNWDSRQVMGTGNGNWELGQQTGNGDWELGTGNGNWELGTGTGNRNWELATGTGNGAE
ncbi:fermitin family homolog 3-like [Melopsittacus undulatus]|uniref:fermitin family homolog 3-like n=1 Tax=Melopsittacus undulatus TaxID=13146 RepID=UPI00146A4111|nr:fermitin family homolog 3-like [Melopsittacus undulatus]